MYDISKQYTDDIATHSFNIHFDLIYDKCSPLPAKAIFYLFLLCLFSIQHFLTNQDF